MRTSHEVSSIAQLFAFAVIPVACTGARQPQPLAEVEALRADIAQPARFPVRHGIAVDAAGLKAAVDRFAIAERDLLAARFTAELRALPLTSPPAAAEYGTVVALVGADLEPLGDALAVEYALDPDPQRLALRSVFMALPTQMARMLGATVSTIAGWMEFLRVAKPVASVCGRDDEHATVCLDYGSLDVFVVTLGTRGPTWVPQSITWLQRGRK